MSALQGLRDWWQARERRERVMLAVMFAMLGGFALWYGMVTPMRWLGDAARRHYDRAAITLVSTQADLRDIARLKQASPTPPTGEQLVARVLGAADRAGVAISRQHSADDGALTVGIDSTEAAPLLTWLDNLRREHGISPRSVDIGKRNGRLQVEVSFAATPP